MTDEIGGVVRNAKASSLDKLAELFEEIKQTPKVDIIIMSPRVWGQLQQALPDIEDEPIQKMASSSIGVYIHWALGDLIVYGSSKNKLIETILSTCQEAV